MATHSPTATIFPNGVVSVSSTDGTAYDEIIQSMNGTNYIIRRIYIQTLTTEQLLQILTLQRYDTNGNIKEEDVVPTVDPNQPVNALYLDFTKNKYILDGRLNIGYDVLGSQSLNFYIENTIIANKDLLKDPSDFNIEFLKTYGFFKEYQDKLIFKV